MCQLHCIRFLLSELLLQWSTVITRMANLLLEQCRSDHSDHANNNLCAHALNIIINVNRTRTLTTNTVSHNFTIDLIIYSRIPLARNTLSLRTECLLIGKILRGFFHRMNSISKSVLLHLFVTNLQVKQTSCQIRQDGRSGVSTTPCCTSIKLGYYVAACPGFCWQHG